MDEDLLQIHGAWAVAFKGKQVVAHLEQTGIARSSPVTYVFDRFEHCGIGRTKPLKSRQGTGGVFQTVSGGGKLVASRLVDSPLSGVEAEFGPNRTIGEGCRLDALLA